MLSDEESLKWLISHGGNFEPALNRLKAPSLDESELMNDMVAGLLSFNGDIAVSSGIISDGAFNCLFVINQQIEKLVGAITEANVAANILLYYSHLLNDEQITQLRSTIYQQVEAWLAMEPVPVEELVDALCLPLDEAQRERVNQYFYNLLATESIPTYVLVEMLCLPLDSKQQEQLAQHFCRSDAVGTALCVGEWTADQTNRLVLAVRDPDQAYDVIVQLHDSLSPDHLGYLEQVINDPKTFEEAKRANGRW
ncbi:MAG: hypothetical protein E6Q36_00175 [Chryseobacterium sp.]|nr:MAG: hypothetical protein E6Q36_00175 [Chryseobacterium sp.]